MQKPKVFSNTREGNMAETHYKLGTQLPYMFIINRPAHYIKVVQRELIGSWKNRQDLERELNIWLKQYIADQENPPTDVRSRRPLYSAQIQVLDVEGDPGWYQVAMQVRPHFKYMGARFELSLVGRLDKEEWFMAALLNWQRGSPASLFDRIQGKDQASASDTHRKSCFDQPTSPVMIIGVGQNTLPPRP